MPEFGESPEKTDSATTSQDEDCGQHISSEDSPEGDSNNEHPSGSGVEEEAESLAEKRLRKAKVLKGILALGKTEEPMSVGEDQDQDTAGSQSDEDTAIISKHDLMNLQVFRNICFNIKENLMAIKAYRKVWYRYLYI